MAKLTDITELSNKLEDDNLIHVVDIKDNSQDPAGSSFKLRLITLYNWITSKLDLSLQNVLNAGNSTGGTNILVETADAIELKNGSLLKEGTYEFGGGKGISKICSVGYEDNWQSGIRHVFDNSGNIRESSNCFNIIPDNTFDGTLRFKVGSRWVLDNGDVYVCSDASTGAAVWDLYSNQVNADWNATSGVAEILNKPSIPAAQIQSDWNQTNNASLDYIKNKPTISNGISHATASGTDTYTATITGVTSYADGDAYLIRFTNGNTTNCTLNINSLGAINLYRNNDGALIGGDIQANGEMLCVYNSTNNNFQTIGTSPNSLISYVTNADSVTITKGMPVYAFGGVGDRMTVKRAYNTTDATSAQTVGIVLSASIAANQKGLILMQGLLDGLSILPTSTFADGDTIYLGATAGTITNVKPYAPNHLVYLGVVTTASNGSAGRMYVRCQNGYELDELHNVQAQSPTLKDTLYYDNTVSPAQWKTASISTILGYTPEALSNKVTTFATLNNNLYPTTLAVSNLVATKQDTLVSGTNIKTVNSSSLLGSGNISVGTVTSVAALTLGTTGTDVSSTVATGTTTPVITFNLPTASATNRGALSSTDWSTFNGKQNTITTGTTSQYFRGDLSLATFPTIPTVTPSALTKTDDTNVTLTLGGSASTSLLAATSLTLGWTGTLADSRITSASTWNAKADYAPRVQSVTSSATVTPTSTNDLVKITAQAAGLTIANPTGTMSEGQSLMIRIKDNGTAQTIGFGTNYRAVGITLPTTTVISKTLYLGCIWNDTDTKFDVIGISQQA